MPAASQVPTSRIVLLAMTLFLSAVAMYMPVVYDGYDFIDFDDYKYVKYNTYIHGGFTVEALLWACKGDGAVFPMPLTWYSYMLDIELFGLNPSGMHMTNILHHALNTVLLFLWLLAIVRRTIPAAETGRGVWVSACLALLFAVHPLQVESVVWIAERNNLLSTMFWLLAMLAYFWYTHKINGRRYLIVTLLFVLGLASKPVVVTLPCVLWLMDFWPLRRVSWPYHEPAQRRQMLRLALEKIPWLLLSVVCGGITYLAVQKSCMAPIALITLTKRLANAVVSYAMYLQKNVWPADLCILYPYPEHLPCWQVTLSCSLLLAISLLALRQLPRHPWLAVGWLWFVGTLMPVIGITQAGAQSMADRFTYVPNIGIYLIAGWAALAWMQRWHHAAGILTLVTLFVSVYFTNFTGQYLPRWKDTRTLFTYVIAVTKNNHPAYKILGDDASYANHTTEAIAYYKIYLRLTDNDEVRANLGSLLLREGHIEEAKLHLLEALRLNSRLPHAYHNLGLIHYRTGNFPEAVRCYQQAITADPMYFKSYVALGNIWGELGEYEKAIAAFHGAIQLDGKSVEAHYGLGLALARAGQSKAAWLQYRILRQLNVGKAEELYRIIQLK
jgi:Flp pilus assembly protein TadD